MYVRGNEQLTSVDHVYKDNKDYKNKAFSQ